MRPLNDSVFKQQRIYIKIYNRKVIYSGMVTPCVWLGGLEGKPGHFHFNPHRVLKRHVTPRLSKATNYKNYPVFCQVCKAQHTHN